MEDLVVCRPSCFWGGSENFFYINAFLELKSSSEAKTPGDWLVGLSGPLGVSSWDFVCFSVVGKSVNKTHSDIIKSCQDALSVAFCEAAVFLFL